MQENMISKSQFKPRALEFFRQVEETGSDLIITDHGRPVLKIVPFAKAQDRALKALRNTVVEYRDPCGPIAEDEWEVLE